jgi:phage terminase small subunit
LDRFRAPLASINARAAIGSGWASRSINVTPKQERFVEEYLIDLNATQAATRAGYSAKTANEQGARLLANVSVRSALEVAMTKRSEKTGIDAEYVLQTIVQTMERCKQATPVLDKRGDPVMVETADGGMAPAYTFEPNAVLKGAELLGKHLKLWTDKMEHSGSIGIADAIRQGKAEQ